MADNFLNSSGLEYLCRSLNVVFARKSQQLPVIAGIPVNEDSGSMELYSKNLNNIVTSGFYNAMLCTNSKYQYSTLIVIGYYLTGYCTQIQFDVTTGEMATRSQINGTWSTWKVVNQTRQTYSHDATTGTLTITNADAT